MFGPLISLASLLSLPESVLSRKFNIYGDHGNCRRRNPHCSVNSISPLNRAAKRAKSMHGMKRQRVQYIPMETIASTELLKRATQGDHAAARLIRRQTFRNLLLHA
jgi:hypothetical protein